MPTPVGEEPRRDGAGDRSAPGRARRPHSYPEGPGSEAVTVEQLLARTGAGHGERRRRAAHSAGPENRPIAPAARPGFPPVPPSERPSWAGGPAPARGLPPVPAAERAPARAALPVAPGPERAAPCPGR
jgi:hypothetical protein